MKINDKNPPKVPVRNRVVERPDLQPTVEDEPEEESPNKIDAYLKAAEELNRTSKHATAIRSKFLVHQNTFFSSSRITSTRSAVRKMNPHQSLDRSSLAVAGRSSKNFVEQKTHLLLLSASPSTRVYQLKLSSILTQNPATKAKPYTRTSSACQKKT
jgi:hypothetical protein